MILCFQWQYFLKLSNKGNKFQLYLFLKIMNLSTFLIISVVIAVLGAMIGGSMVVVEKRQTPTSKPQRTGNNKTRTHTSRKQLFVPMISVLGLSIFLLVIGYINANIITSSVGFLLLFFGFGLFGSFLFNELF